MSTTIFIVPAWSDQAGQCRIVARDGFEGDALKDYRKNPGCWREVGLMNSRGELVCFSSDKVKNGAAALQELRGCVPLMAGLQFSV